MRGDFMAEEISRERILTELAELAFCRSNDAVRLVFIAEEGTPALEGLDLRTLAGIHTSANGSVEVKFIDRTKLIELLLKATEEQRDPAAEAAQLISAMERSADKLAGLDAAGGGCDVP